MNAIDPPVTAQASALAARYGTEPKASKLPWNGVIAHLLSHRSVRGYKTDPVPPGTLETLIAAAQSAATSSNLQTWSVMEVTDPEKRKVLAEVASGQKHIIDCPLFLVFIADLSRNERLGKAEGTTLEVLPYLDAFLVASIDAAMAAQNAVIAAESLGLSTVYIGALRNNVTRVAELLELPSGAGPVFGLCVGYAKPESAGEVKPRLPQEVVLHHDRYSTAAEAEGRAAYDKRLEDFSRRHEMGAYTWTQRVINRMAKLNALTGRDRMKDAFKALGFPLR
jgi:nitroreductase